MSLRIYNTLTRKKEDFQTLVPGKVSMYVCGPTVYNKAHVGHAMSALVFDILRRYFIYRGYEVRYVMNFTDVDDKIIRRANEMKVDPFRLADGYILEYQKNLEQLNILPATLNPRATQEMQQIIQMVSGLEEKKMAYAVDGDVYFRVSNDAEYGKLSGRHLEDMQAGARIEVDNRKEHPMDFALWKSAQPGEPSWESPWGKGRPGWHIECSAMNLHHLGEQIDIHGGGNDLIFPHHENEIAQTETYTGKPFAHYWVHNGMLQFGGEKMSKSIGNLVTIDEFLAKHTANTLRIMILNTGYQSPLTFNDEVIGQAEKAIERLLSGLRPAQAGASGLNEEGLISLASQVEKTHNGFMEAMDDNFNTAGALGNLFDLVRAINQARADGAVDDNLKSAQDQLLELAGVLGLKLNLSSNETDINDHKAAALVDLLIELRSDLRRQKLWALSDLIRDRLTGLGIILEDTKDGTSWRWS
jgi:cysteinyl-tRNA synthetase